MPNPMIPQSPDLMAANAAAGAGAPVQRSQPNNQIPANPMIAAQHVVAPQAPARADPSLDFFSQNDWSDEGPLVDDAPPPAPPAASGVDLLSQDDLLGSSPPEYPPVAQAPSVQDPTPPPVQVQQAPVASPPPAQPTAEEITRNAIDFLKGNTYSLDDDLRRRMIAEPDVAMPELAARVHVNIVRELGQYMHSVLPQLVEQHAAKQMASQAAEMEFFGRYPRLNRPEFKPIIAESLRMVKTFRPDASREEIMREGATLAAHRIRSAPQFQAQQPPPARVAPPPFVPAQTRAGAPQPQGGVQNVWADLSNDPDLLTF